MVRSRRGRPEMNAEAKRHIAETSPEPRWWLPLAFALLPLLATHVAYALSVRDGLAPSCWPYWDGCTSISRAARHGLGNLVFKTVMLPCACVLALLWLHAANEFRARGESVRVLLGVGLLGALALAVYVGFLGVEGEFSRWLRRYGAVIYFASTFLAQFAYVRSRWHARTRSMPVRGLLLVSVLLLLGGLSSTAVSGLVHDLALKDRAENAIEWGLGLLFTLWFLLLSWSWRRDF